MQILFKYEPDPNEKDNYPKRDQAYWKEFDRQKYLHDEASQIAAAKERGSIAAAREIALRMKNMGIEQTYMSKVTGLSLEEIEKL